MEMADVILINKADGDLKSAATRTCADYAGALRLLRKRPQDPAGYPCAMTVSALEENGLDRTKAILNHESGLLGLSGGKSDMRKLMLDPSEDSTFAVDHFCYWTLRHAGSLIAALEGVDAIAFTGGIGENAKEVRARILAGLQWAGVQFDPEQNERNAARLHRAISPVSVWIIPAEEEREIAMDAVKSLNAG
jgi:acetate kinase